jgi:hypothetical protein
MRERSTTRKGTFFSFLGQSENRRLLIIILTGITVEFVLFKLLYPFPDFFSDSYSYIYAAVIHSDVNIWPIGYSKFLQWFPWITRSHLGLVAFQYYFLELSAAYLFFTLQYFHPLRWVLRNALVVFLFFNPLLLYIANYVTSDALFISISLLWFTQLIWIMQKPRPQQVIIQGILLLLAFTIRYNAMYYPVIAAFAFLISRHRTWAKVAGLLIGPLLILPFILHSRTAAKELTGTAQFPLLGGWQWGNNALYMREFVEVDSNAFPSTETAALDRIARNFFRTVPPDQRDLPNYVANYFIRQGNSPLKIYLHQKYPTRSEFGNLVAWGKASPVFGEYGKFIIKQSPFAFARHYLLVNTKNYLLPPLEKLELYNLGADSIWHRGQSWFELPTPKIRVANKYMQGALLLPFPLLFLLLNVFFGIVLVQLLRRQRFEAGGPGFAQIILMVTAFFILNFAFSVFANIIVIRYQVLPMILLATFSLLSLEYLLSRSGRKAIRSNLVADTVNNYPEIHLKASNHATIH